MVREHASEAVPKSETRYVGLVSIAKHNAICHSVSAETLEDKIDN